ncbi:synaptotagmin-like protein 2 isoform X3 [Polyodon spathula]|uniref:synaptotagmin-like protein 2 isoform X3 n=1 Tax=Polyodon spathula TaxID=7913 RepID=UPI001B7DAFAE|nr:synaptotagmin-like protein 2 isoform X3 [Polyodon spathula]
MIDLSYLTEEEQEMIMQVLKRDAALKQAEEDRIKKLQKSEEDNNKLKYMSGEWFYEAKSRRHRDKVHGADIIRASMRKKKPVTLYELSQSRGERPSWSNSVNKDVFIPPELTGLVEEPEEKESEESVIASEINATQQERLRQAAPSPVKQRQNPFNDSSVRADALSEGRDNRLTNGKVASHETSKGDQLSSPRDTESSIDLPTTENFRLSQGIGAQAPVPKKRTVVYNPQDSELGNESPLQRQQNRSDLNNSAGVPKGILKRNSSSSSSSNDSEINRFNSGGIQEPQRNRSIMLPSVIPETVAEKTLPSEQNTEGFSQNSIDRKQVRFLPGVSQRDATVAAQLVDGKEMGEHSLLESEFAGTANAKTAEGAEGNGLLQSKTFSTSRAPETLKVHLSTSDKPQQLEETSLPASFISKEQSPSLPESMWQAQSGNRVTHNYQAVDTNESLRKREVTEMARVDINPPQITVGQHEFHAESPLVSSLQPVSAVKDERSLNNARGELVLSAEDDQHSKVQQIPKEIMSGFSTVPSHPVSLSLDSKKMKEMSMSVPAFLQQESDGTDSTSESSFHIGRHKKTASSLTNLSNSSGMASMSSVSSSVMSIYSGDFGNVDVKGNIQFTIDYVSQLKEFHIFVVQCKDLAEADVKKHHSHPYVKSYLLPDKAKMGKRKTAVKKKTLNPTYNEILRYKIDKETLMTQTLNLSVWHNDTFGRNSFLGEVDVDLSTWNWDNKQMNWFPLKPRAPSGSQNLEHRGEMRIALRFIPQVSQSKKKPNTGEVHIWVKDCKGLPALRASGVDPFVKCSVLPDTSRKSRQKTRVLKKTSNPLFNHTMVYDGFRPEDLKEACVELTVWDHDRLVNHFLGGLRLGLGTGKSYGTAVDWMDSIADEAMLWERMMDFPNEWVEDVLPLRMLMMAK